MGTGFRGVVGSFDHLSVTIDAFKGLKKAGYQGLTVLSPICHHEIDDLIESAPSPVRFFTLVGGLLGCAAGFALTIWTSLDWPLLTSGKPIVSIPPFVVIAFELTILLGALGTLLGLFLTARLPFAPIKVAFDPQFSEGRFGIMVQCLESQASTVKDALKSFGAGEVRLERS